MLPIERKKVGKEKSFLEQYFEMKRQMCLPLKLKIYFTILEKWMDGEEKKKGKSTESGKQISKAFLRAFTKLSIDEQAYYMFENIKYIKNKLEQNESSNDKQKQSQLNEIRHIETTCEMNFFIMKISYWAPVTFILDKGKRQIIINNKKKNMILDLRSYLVRRSKKYKTSVVLEGASDQIRNDDSRKVTFSFLNLESADKIYQQIFKCIINYRSERLLALMLMNQEKDAEDWDGSIQSDKTLVFLNSKNVNQFLNYKDSVLKKLLTTKFDFHLIYSNSTSNSISTSNSYYGLNDLKIQRSLKTQKVFKLEQTIKMPSKMLKEKFINCFNYKNKYLIHSQVLEDFSKKYKAIYQKQIINGKIHESISIREESLTDEEQLLFLKGVENIMIKNYIEFLLAKVRQIDQSTSKLIVLASINLSPSISLEVVKAYMVELSQMLFRQEEEENLENQVGKIEEEEFQTVYGIYDDKQEHVQFVEGEDEIGEYGDILPSNQNMDLSCKNYLFKKHILIPSKFSENNKKLMKQHYLFKEWMRRKNGGVVCTNQSIINEQKKIFKSVLTMMKNNLLSGGSILNISLPVNIFKRESHLESIARDFCYAPLFFERIGVNFKADPIERVKYATLLCISVGTLGISMDKPFNPILGETLQVWIGGCPMYLQQVSHHPPIGSYYFVGRGYKIYGQIQPKITFGMNSVKGFSERPNYLIFDDDETKLQMSYGKMIIKGMLFGERQFNFEQKIFVYDHKNHLFSEIIYGPKKKGMLMKSTEPLDYVYGKIYHVKPEFSEKFISQKQFPTKQFIISEVSQFQGIWNDIVKFDGVEYINFKGDLPCDIQYEEHPLPSNSSYRTDLTRLKENNIEEAQRQKQRLEEIQRRDRRLRENMIKQRL